jgi:hypothetical protein
VESAACVWWCLCAAAAISPGAAHSSALILFAHTFARTNLTRTMLSLGCSEAFSGAALYACTLRYGGRVGPTALLPLGAFAVGAGAHGGALPPCTVRCRLSARPFACVDLLALRCPG